METPSFFNQTVAVLFGGRSSEHEISLRSAIYILKNIPEKYFIIPVGISREGAFHSLNGKFKSSQFQNITVQDLQKIVDGQNLENFPNNQNVESIFLPLRIECLSQSLLNSSIIRILNAEVSCVFPVLHGTNGEDGRIQGLFELAQIAYVGCDIRASVIGIDKDIQKRLARDAGVLVAKYDVVDVEEFTHDIDNVIQRIEEKIGYPCFVKPNSLGSAVGANKVKNKLELKSALAQATAFDSKAIVEELCIGTEVECAFLGNSIYPRITSAGEIATKEFYTYEEKYAAHSQAELFIPARLSEKRMDELKGLAIKIAKTMGIAGFSRIDFWNILKTEQFVFNEFNTIPGLTSISMFPKLWEFEGLSSEKWIEELIVKSFHRKTILDRIQYGIHPQSS